MVQGIDISRWQGVIDWNQVKNAKQLAIIKLGGSDDGFYPDGQASRNTQEVRRLGLPHGFYFYLGGVHDTDAEAQHILNLISGIGGLQPGGRGRPHLLGHGLQPVRRQSWEQTLRLQP